MKKGLAIKKDQIEKVERVVLKPSTAFDGQLAMSFMTERDLDKAMGTKETIWLTPDEARGLIEALQRGLRLMELTPGDSTQFVVSNDPFYQNPERFR